MASRSKALPLATAALLALAAAPLAAKPNWNQSANIKSAAERLAQLQRARGAIGTFQFIDACYRTHSLASSYSEAFEACIVQDYIHSSLTAAVYQRIPKETRERMRSPDPEAIIAAMTRRISQAFAHYKLPPAEARAFLKLVDEQGLKVFGKARFPEADAGQDRPGGRPGDDTPEKE